MYHPYAAEVARAVLVVVVRATSEAVFVAVVLAVVNPYDSSRKEIAKKRTLFRNGGQAYKSQFLCDLSTGLLDTTGHQQHTIRAVPDTQVRCNFIRRHLESKGRS
jgi:hypothetical protein